MIQNQIFDETNEIDIAFVGSSKLLYDIDTPYVQQRLDERLGRKTVVRTICWAGPGFDGLYFICKDLLEHRRVKMLVFCDESHGVKPNHEAPHWFRICDEPGELGGLPLQDQGVYYFAAMVGMGRSWLEWLTPNLPPDTNCSRSYYVGFDNPWPRLGSLRWQLSYDPASGNNTHFVPDLPQPRMAASDICSFNSMTASNFTFLDQPLPAWQIYFAQKFGLLAKERGSQLVVLHVPTYGEKDSSSISESRFWPDFLKARVEMIGVPGKKLFAGIPQKELGQLFVNPGHLNQNGQTYFTTLITPALLQTYEKELNH